MSHYIKTNISVTDTLTGESEVIRTSTPQEFLDEHYERYTQQGYSLSMGGQQINDLSHPLPQIDYSCTDNSPNQWV